MDNFYPEKNYEPPVKVKVTHDCKFKDAHLIISERYVKNANKEYYLAARAFSLSYKNNEYMFYDVNDNLIKLDEKFEIAKFALRKAIGDYKNER